jgi:hypothetical protein
MSRCRPLLGRVPRVRFPDVSAPTAALRLLAPRRRLASRSAPPFRWVPEATRPPRFLVDPCARAPFSDPGGGLWPGPRALRPYVWASSCCLPRYPPRRPPRTCGSRGSIAPPMHSLSTLRSWPHDQTTQDSLPTGGPCLVGRDFHPRVALKVSCCYITIPFLQAYPGARTKPLRGSAATGQGEAGSEGVVA